MNTESNNAVLTAVSETVSEGSGDKNQSLLSPEMNAAYRKMTAAADEVEKVVVGKRTEVILLLTAMLAGSHVLIEDLPSTG